MTLFDKLLNNVFETTLGVSVQEIKSDWYGKNEDPNISVYTTAYSYPEGKAKEAHLNIRVIANVKLTERSKAKKVMIIVPFDQVDMEKIINELRAIDSKDTPGK
jgi:predicted RNA-binding protein